MEKHFAVPQLVAVHAVRILGQAQQKCGQALLAARKVAIRTLGAHNIFTAHGAVHFIVLINTPGYVLTMLF
jgi:hypothetical protein